MPVKTTLSFTERHHRFLLKKVAEGVFATQSAAVASTLDHRSGVRHVAHLVIVDLVFDHE